MAKKKSFYASALAIIKKPKKKRPGVHSKSKHTNQKTGKYYTGTKYKGQGR
jgi:hypothetical protein